MIIFIYFILFIIINKFLVKKIKKNINGLTNINLNHKNIENNTLNFYFYKIAHLLTLRY